ncbi:MAG: hypothetical protein AAFP93_00840 [Bacteroidota bacterium]
MINHHLRLYFSCVSLAIASVAGCTPPTQTEEAKVREELIEEVKKKIAKIPEAHLLGFIGLVHKWAEETYTLKEKQEVAEQYAGKLIAACERKVEKDLAGAEGDLEKFRKKTASEGEASVKAVYEVLIQLLESLIREKKADSSH